jgi:hypothetical protein
MILLSSPLIYPESFWILPLDSAIVAALLMLGAAYWLILRPFVVPRERKPPLSRHSPFYKLALQSMGDGFLAFSVLSFLLNLMYMLTHHMDMHVDYDLWHLVIIIRVANVFWEGVLSRLGDQTILWLLTVAVFDGCIGMLTGLIISPLQRLPRARIPVFALLMILAVTGWLIVVEWEQLRPML